MNKEEKNQDKHILENLTDEEKNILYGILTDVSKNGKSDELNELYYKDYEEIPVDIITFLTDDQYLGHYTNNGKDIKNL